MTFFFDFVDKSAFDRAASAAPSYSREGGGTVGLSTLGRLDNGFFSKSSVSVKFHCLIPARSSSQGQGKDLMVMSFWI